jgi:hypothetical protein
MPTHLLATCLKQFTTLGCNNLVKKERTFLMQQFDDLVRALEQQTHYKMNLMGRLKGIGPNQMELRLRAAHRFGDPKKIAQVVINSILGVLCIYCRSIGLEGEKRFGSCKRNLNTMIGSPHDSHCLDKEFFSAMTWGSFYKGAREHCCI